MTPLDDLPPEQRAVLELVLKRGRSYDEIASLLSIDRARVRQRALAGLDALGPDTSLSPERRSLITDYLLGQLPGPVSEQVAARLAQDPADRAWARVIASELRPVASAPLPEIPTGAPIDEADEFEPEGPPTESPPRETPTALRTAGPRTVTPPRSSRLGGAILLGIGALAVVVVVVLVLVLTSSSGHKASTTTSGVASTPTRTPTQTATAAGSGSGTSGTTPKGLATVHLSPPNSKSKAQGVAEAFAQSSKFYLAIVAINLAANSHNYYAVWLSNSPSDSRLIGYSQPVTSNGRLQAAGTLTASDSRYKTLLVTLETSVHAKQPGTTVLSGAFNFKAS